RAKRVEYRIETRERVIADLLGTRVSERSVARRPAGAALRGLLHQLQQMAQLLALGAEVVPGDVGRRDFQGDALDDLEAVAVERDVLARSVGHQAHAADSQVAQDLGADAVIALVGPEAQALVGLDRVVSLLLQLVGAQLVHQADAAALLEEVEEDAVALLLDLLERAVELGAAVAAGGVEDVAGQALAVDADEDRHFGIDLAHDQGDV